MSFKTCSCKRLAVVQHDNSSLINIDKLQVDPCRLLYLDMIDFFGVYDPTPLSFPYYASYGNHLQNQIAHIDSVDIRYVYST